MMIREFAAPASPLARVRAFLAAFQAADNNDDLELRIGETAAGEAAVAITLRGKTHGFTVSEARKLAALAEEAMRAFPMEPAVLANLILVLRAGADKAEAHRGGAR